MERILIVEDEKKLLSSLEDFFKTQGFEAICTMSGEEGVRMAVEKVPDLVILDIMLPDLSGYDVCRRIKEKMPSIRILMLSAKGEEVDKVVGLELGADDYMTKPFGVRELLARVRALLRRGGISSDEITHYSLGDVKIDLESYQVIRRGKKTKLTALENKILKHLISHRNNVVTREELLNEIWGFDVYPTTRTVDNLILKLRKKIEKDPNDPAHIITVYGAGYKFVG
ncbi:MAG: response regulator transcription factor [Candidatus Tritonobacter lacicola]|nr:response regulator transcription factor [Candidatus Tritonobacter lacicola]